MRQPSPALSIVAMLLFACTGSDDPGLPDAAALAESADASPPAESPADASAPVQCGPENCAGCCDATGACVSGALDAACGAGGATCDVCTDGDTCEAGECGLPSDVLWTLKHVSATFPSKTCAGGDYDGDGNLPDPFAEVQRPWDDPGDYWSLGGEVGNTLDPIWNHYMVTSRSTAYWAGTMRLRFWDDDDNAPDLMGTCTFPVDEDDVGGHLRVVSCPRNCFAGDASAITYRFRIVPKSAVP